MGYRIKHFIVSIGLLLLCISCRKEYTPLEYKNWIESDDNGLQKSKSFRDLEYQVQYQTNEYLLLLNKGPEGIKNTDIEKELSLYNDDHKMLFTINHLEGIPPLKYALSNDQQYYARLEYLNYKVMDDFVLVQGGDTTNCRFAHFERDFGISPSLRINLSFENIHSNQDIQLCFDDKIFNNGMIKFTFYSKDLIDLPELINDK